MRALAVAYCCCTVHVSGGLATVCFSGGTLIKIRTLVSLISLFGSENIARRLCAWPVQTADTWALDCHANA